MARGCKAAAPLPGGIGVAEATLTALLTGRADGAVGGRIDIRTGQVLTQRESDVLRLLALRYSNKEIARELLISAATVKKHTVSLYQKLHVGSRREAVEKATALGYLNE